MKRPIVHLLAVVMASATLPLTGCSTWHLQPGPPNQGIEDRNPDRVRLTTADGVRIVVENPAVVDSTTTADVRGEFLYEDWDMRKIGVPLSTIIGIELRKRSIGTAVGRSGIILFVTTFVLWAVLAIASASSEGGFMW